jgi:VWFA-related protein
VSGNSAAKLYRENADTAEYAPVLSPSQGRMNAAMAESDRYQAGDVTAQVADLSVSTTLNSMQLLARYLTGISGRKNLIWFSNSFPIDLTPDVLAPDVLDGNPGSTPQGASALEFQRNYGAQVREAGRLLSAARVAVYPVYAGTPRASASLAAAHDILSTNRGLGSSHTAREDAITSAKIETDQASMKDIAQQTGGQFFNTVDFKEALASAIENGASYYTLAYIPTGKLDGKYRSLKLRLQDANLHDASYDISYRRGFYADPPDKPSPSNPGQPSPLMVAATPGTPPATEIQFQARVLPATDPQLQGSKLPNAPAGALAASLKGKGQTYVVDLKVDPHSFAFADSPDGSHQAAVEFVVVAFNAQIKRVNYTDSAGKMNLNPAQFDHLMRDTIAQRLALDLPPGEIALRIVVYDPTSTHAGSLELPLTVAAK